MSFDCRSALLELRNSRTGSLRKSVMPKLARSGPMPRIITFLGVFPLTMNPPIMSLSPVSTRKRLERFKA